MYIIWVEEVLMEETIFLLIFDSVKWWCYQNHVNQVTSNHTTLWILDLPIFNVFVSNLLFVNLSLNQTLLIFLLYMRQTWKTWLIQAISLWGVICLLYERIHYSNLSFAVYMKEGLAFAWNSSLENSEYSYLCFQLDLFCSVF